MRYSSLSQINRDTAPLARIYPFGWQGASATVVNMKSPTRFEVGANPGVVRSAVESYAWSPSQDQCGMLRPLGTSSADWW
jgi:hypothetical protein